MAHHLAGWEKIPVFRAQVVITPEEKVALERCQDDYEDAVRDSIPDDQRAFFADKVGLGLGETILILSATGCIERCSEGALWNFI
jgi:hypothetical protein